MLRTRVIPVLLLRGRGLVKTVKFGKPQYVGDPINAVRIFNDKEVDELVFLDITATPEGRAPLFDLVEDIASEAFMPFCYGGGVTRLDEMERLFSLGVEKVALNTSAVRRPELITQAAKEFGSQSVVVSIDARKGLFGGYKTYSQCGTQSLSGSPVEQAKRAEELGAGEILIQAIHRDGTQEGYDLDLVRQVAAAVSVPVVPCGGAGSLTDINEVVRSCDVNAAAAGSLFVFYGKHRSVLINYPSPDELTRTLEPADNGGAA